MPANTVSAPRASGGAPRRRLPLRLALGGLLLLAGLAAGHALLWHWMSGQLEAGFAAWAGARRAAGWRVEHDAPVRGGWPRAATLTLPRFRLEGGGATLPGGMAWEAEAVVLRIAPPRLDRLVVEPGGRQRLRLGEAELPFAADRLALTLPLESGVLPREAALETERLRIGLPAGGLEARRARLEVETRMTATEGEPAVSLRLSAAEVTLPTAPTGSPGTPAATPSPVLAALGRRVESLELDVALTGPVPPGRDPAGRAEAWREGGGTLELHALTLRWGPVGATATATMTLDDALQPMGAGTLRVTNGAAALDAAAAAGLLAPGAVLGARTVLALMARTPPEGGPPQVEVPLTLENRTLALARVTVARLVPWRWPAAPVPEGITDPSLPARD